MFIGPFEEPRGDLPNDWLSFNLVTLASTRQDWEEEKEEEEEEEEEEEKEAEKEEEKEVEKEAEKEEEKEVEKEEDKKAEEEEVASLAASRMAHTGVTACWRGGFSGSLRFPPSMLNLNFGCQCGRK